MVGKLLEKCYIHSTDIEYSQYYNKELTLLIDNLINERKLGGEVELDVEDLTKKVEKIFLEIDSKKDTYFL